MNDARAAELDHELSAAFPLQPTVVSSALAVRPLTLGDSARLTQILGGDRDMTWTHRSWDQGNVDYVLGLRLDHYGAHGFGVYGVEDLLDGTLIGMAGLQYWDDSCADIEVIAFIARARWGHGIASTLLKWCVDRAFGECPSVSRIVAATRPDNGAARSLVQGLGMEHTGRHEHWGVVADTWTIERETYRHRPKSE